MTGASAASSQRPALSVCVIGRDEAENLPDLFADIRAALARVQVSTEVIFVDSASFDRSAAIAHQHCDCVIELGPDPRHNAGAARAVATAAARGEWILYLDGDMRLEEDFLAQYLASETLREHSAGFFGRCAEISDGAVQRTNLYGEWLKPGPAQNFGGAVVLRRAAVIAAGGWSHGLYSSEELDLYVRLRRAGLTVQFVDAPMTSHPAIAASRRLRVADLFRPRGSLLGKKFAGFGQHLHAAAARGYLGAAVRYAPLPFMLWSASTAAVVLTVVSRPWSAFGVFALVAGLIAWRRAPRFVVVYAAMAVQAAYGWPRYAGEWQPRQVRLWRRCCG